MKMKCVVVAGLILGLPQTPGYANSYRVTVADSAPETVHVEASLALSSDLVGLVITNSDQLPNGQADLVRNLSITDATGREVPSEATAGGDWRLAGTSAGDVVSVSYDVLLEHDRYHWGPGIDEVAYKTDDGLFFKGASLFMISGMESEESVTVEFVLPEGWIASTPWAVKDGEYEASGTMDLAHNCFFLGSHLEEIVTLGEFQFVMAIGNDLAPVRQLFVDTMEALLPAFVRTFGGLPDKTRYLVVINRSGRSDGGAFVSSYSMLINGDVDETSSVVWGHGIAHELFHFWNGHTLFPTSPSEEEWFKEGFTDYYTIVHRSRAGLDTRANTYRKLENTARRYVVAKRMLGIEDSMREAGADKHRKRFLVYGGGTLVALSLDVQIREATDNRKSLEEVMRRMYEEFGKSGKTYSYDDIVRISSAVIGSDMADFFGRYVRGTEMLDIAPTFTAMGLRLETVMDEFYLTEAESPSELQREIRVSMLGLRPPISE